MIVSFVSAVSSACRQDMHDQPRHSALQASAFFTDGAASRAPVPGTVARGQLRDDELLYSGKIGSEPVDLFPFPVDAAVMARGRDAFNAFCSPCHGRTGLGDGMIVQRGFTRPPNLTGDLVRKMPVGHVFDVITNGFGAMPDHAAQIKVRDRWAIAAYVRALQLSASATLAEVPPDERSRLEQQP
jgi:mono/diheme cytochrome c family protein